MNEINLSKDQMLEIAQMAAQLLIAQLQQVQKAHMEILGATKDFFDKHPDMRGKHKELSEVITRLEKSSPGLSTQQLFDLASAEVMRNAD